MSLMVKACDFMSTHHQVHLHLEPYLSAEAVERLRILLEEIEVKDRLRIRSEHRYT